MKARNIARFLVLALLLAFAVAAFASCAYVEPIKDKIGTIIDGLLPENEPEEKPEDEKPEDEKPEEPVPMEELWAKTYDCITVADALDMCEDYVSSPSTERYYIIATVVSVDSDTYGQLTVRDDTGEIMVYGSRSADGSLRYDAMDEKPAAGDVILIYGTLQHYNSTTKEIQSAWIIDFYTPDGADTEPEITVKPGDTITVEQAIAIAGKVDGSNRYYIRATVSSITNPTYGAMVIEDATGSISVYNSKNADGSVDYAAMEDKPYKGDTVLLYCNLQDFNGNKEIKSAYIVEFEHFEIDEEDYTEMSISEARAAVDAALIKTVGTVARITYANGFIPSGFFLIDNTEAIYVYDGDLAARVAVGNTVTILAQKDYWILSTETENAAKFGYEGCNQLTNAYLVENDELVGEFDKSWIAETTVKDIIDTPFTEDITTTIFKVNALVKKAPGSGFVNYYIDDLDGATGSYVYTQCNGGDFEWLDEFDGKICTVYLSVINAKSTASGCVWRFIPVAVIDEGYTFDTDDTAEFVIDYHGITAFGNPEYMVDAKVELPTVISSELLGFENALISYSVSDTSVASISEIDGKLTFHALAAGRATVTVTGSYGGIEVSKSFEIVVTVPAEYDTIDVSAAIGAENDTEVIVVGIVGPSAVNQNGTFYLIDETGSIPVRGANADVIMEGLSIGDRVVVKGTRTVTKDGGGQIVIDGAEILANYYGEHSYSTDSFITGKTIDEIKATADTAEATVGVYVVEAKLKKNVATYSTTYSFGGLLLYSGGGAQYSWLDQFFADGETEVTVTAEVALCDWNAKGLKGCILSVITDDGKIYNTLNFN